jgi:hypothetical protein
MNYIDPAIFRHGLASEASPLSLILPSKKGDVKTLVVGNDGKPLAILLEEHPWHTISLEHADRYAGTIIHDVEIEVDFGSGFDPNRVNIPLACAIRRAKYLYIRAHAPRSQGFHDIVRVALRSDLPEGDGEDLPFMRWRIVKRLGDTLHVLHSVDATPSAEADD